MTLREVIVDIARRSKMLDEQDADEKLRRCIRLVVDDQEAVPLLDTEPDEIVQVFTTGAIAKLVEQAAA